MILVFGKTGQVARELALMADVTALGRQDADLTDADACARAIARQAPKAVINAAAYTAVDQAEDEPDLANLVNAQAPAAMARACAAANIPFVHISTDYVFDGAGDRPRSPEARTDPINAYGRSKLAGEIAVRDAGGPHAILRASWVFSGHGRNFVTTMLGLASARETFDIVADQIGGPTAAKDIAKACHAIANALCSAPEKSGTYHLSGAPDVSWADFARAIFETAGCPVTVRDITSDQFPTKAPRPRNSRLDCSALASFDLARPNWQLGLAQAIETTKVRK